MASANAKFLFDEDFATGEKPTITLVEFERRRKDAEAVAFRNGFAAAQAEAVAEAEKRLAAAMTQIGDTLARLGRGLDGVEARLEVEAVQVAHPQPPNHPPPHNPNHPKPHNQPHPPESFRQLVAAPHVAIKVNDAMLAGAEQRLGELARTRGFEGRLMVSADPALAPGDCRVEWSDGGINRDRAATEDAIAEVVSRYIAARSADAN
jgi:flagellar assembly protein FliH